MAEELPASDAVANALRGLGSAASVTQQTGSSTASLKLLVSNQASADRSYTKTSRPEARAE